MEPTEVLVAGIAIFLIAWWMMNFFYAIGLLIAIVVGFLLLAWIADKSGVMQQVIEKENAEREKTERAQNALERELAEECENLWLIARGHVESHLEVLKRKYKAGVYKDEYGVEKRGDWESSRDYFFQNVVLPTLDTREFRRLHLVLKKPADIQNIDIEAIRLRIDFYVQACIDTSDEVGAPTQEPRDGIEFEFMCAERLEKTGWRVEMTPRVGDQGVDLLARKGSISAAIQCKNYQAPVGNSAIQEVSAGRAHYGTDYAVVVSDSGFTKAARNLAASNDVVMNLPALPGHPVKRIPFATEVFYEQAIQTEEACPPQAILA